MLAAVLVGGSVAFFLVRSAEEKVTSDMVSRAERFTIPADWKLQGNFVRREMFLCISTNPCPSIAKRWHTGRTLTVDDLANVAAPTLVLVGDDDLIEIFAAEQPSLAAE